MHNLEIVCVILGFICIISESLSNFEGSTKGFLIQNIFGIIRILIYSILIILPLYFNYWR